MPPPWFFKASDLTLADDVVAALFERGADVPLQELAYGFRKDAATLRFGVEEARFEVCVRIWHTLQVLEESVSAAGTLGNGSDGNLTDSIGLVTVFTALEYFLHDLSRWCETNGELRPVALRYNPFLSHWIEVGEELDGGKWRKLVGEGQDTSAWGRAFNARRIVVQIILEDDPAGLKNLQYCTPRELAHQNIVKTTLNLAPYYEILYETGVWDRPARVVASIDDSKTLDTSTLGRGSLQEYASVSTSSMYENTAHHLSQEESEHALRSDPSAAYHYLTNLPIDIPNLELINGILSSQVLSDVGIDQVDLARNFIQHGLRDIEAMAGSNDVFGASDVHGSSFFAGLGAEYASSPPLDFLMNSTAAGPSNSRGEAIQAKGDRDGQIRAVKLLVLFMTNLLKKRITDAEPAGLLYEIEEVCVRYMFVPEVREFRRWLEGDDVEEVQALSKMGG